MPSITGSHGITRFASLSPSSHPYSSLKFPVYNLPSLESPFPGNSTYLDTSLSDTFAVLSGVLQVSPSWPDNQDFVTSSRGARNAFSSSLPIVREQRRGLSFFLARRLQRQRHPPRSEVPTDKSLELRSIVVSDGRKARIADRPRCCSRGTRGTWEKERERDERWFL